MLKVNEIPQFLELKAYAQNYLQLDVIHDLIEKDNWFDSPIFWTCILFKFYQSLWKLTHWLIYKRYLDFVERSCDISFLAIFANSVEI